MSDYKGLIKKVGKTLKEEGVKSLAAKTRRYVLYHTNKDSSKKQIKDILFINGCTLPHPERYRVDHQMEQLESNGLSVGKVFYENIKLSDIKLYKGFVFFRCPITPAIEEFIEKAHYYNKKVFFDIDDLVIDKKYTDTIKYVREMSEEDKKIYDDGVVRMGKTMSLCDCLITTTPALARELKQYNNKVYINKNVASERMLKLSLDAIKKVEKKAGEFKIGYLSGSITHNPDFEMVEPALKKLLKKYSDVKLVVMGYLDLPEGLKQYEDRVERVPFLSWEKLPEIIASLDVNLAPIEKSIFNEAKSENKWTEASLCKVVTVASNFGAFKDVITDEKNGLLCDTSDDWYKKIEEMIVHPEKRMEIAENAHKKAIEEYITTYTGWGLANYIESNLSPSIVFVMPSTNTSGGVNVIIKHCNILRDHGYDVLAVNMDKGNENIVVEDGTINVVSSKTYKLSARFDEMVATLYTTMKYVKEYPNVVRRLYLVQNFETNFCDYGSEVKRQANATYNERNVEYITISEWCKKWLDKKYHKEVKIAKNGIDLDRFTFHDRKMNNKIRILIEGNSEDYYKNVDESFRIVEKLDKDRFEISYLSYRGKPKSWYYVDHFYHDVPHDKIGEVYGNHDILIKSSILESFCYPPLEMMATGGYVVVAPNEGNIEYLEDGKNCLFYKQGDVADAVEKIERIVKDGKLRKTLDENARKTVEDRSWRKIEKGILELYK